MRSASSTHDHHLVLEEPKQQNSTGTDCKVCGQEAHGLHFGVITCRACAAFFRRSIVEKKEYSCRRNDKNCEINRHCRYFCRLCRYLKCLKLGMTSNNVQLNRDSVFASGGETKLKKVQKQKGEPIKLASFVEIRIDEIEKITRMNRPRKITITDEDWREEKEKQQSTSRITPKDKVKTVYDTSNITKNLDDIFRNFKPPLEDQSFRELNTLKRMVFGLNQFWQKHEWDDIKIVEKIPLCDFFAFVEDQIQDLARWMMYSDCFRKLPLEEKIKIFKESEKTLHRMERASLSVKLLGERVVEDKLLFLAPNYVTRMTHTQVDLMDGSREKSSKIENIINPLLGRLMDHVAKPMISMKITDEEIVYIMCQIFWEPAGRCEKETIDISEEFKADLANDMHEYYVNEQATPNYAGRLLKLMRIADAMQKICQERKKALDLAKLFNALTIEFSNTKFFDVV